MPVLGLFSGYATALLSSLVSPEKPGDKSLDDLVALLKNHFNPEPSEIMERYKYHTRMRQPKETVDQLKYSPPTEKINGRG